MKIKLNTIESLEHLSDSYSIDENGNVYTYDGSIMKTRLNKGGYERLNLVTNDGAKTFEIHRLVAKAFVPNPNNYNIVNHIDCNKTNNCADNIEWCTHKQNMVHASDNGLLGKSVEWCGNKFNTLRDFADYLGCTPNTITAHRQNTESEPKIIFARKKDVIVYIEDIEIK